MGTIARNIIMSVSAVLMVILQPITLIAMVIAPNCSGIMQTAGAYKLTSVCAFSSAYYILVLRRTSLIAAITLPAAQIALGWFVIGYLNRLPMTCH